MARLGGLLGSGPSVLLGVSFNPCLGTGAKVSSLARQEVGSLQWGAGSAPGSGSALGDELLALSALTRPHLLGAPRLLHSSLLPGARQRSPRLCFAHMKPFVMC